jgi:hypothetical protein
MAEGQDTGAEEPRRGAADGQAFGGAEAPWWRSDSPLDPAALLGPDGMAAVGSVADEAFKLYAVVKQRLEASGVNGAAVRAAVESIAVEGLGPERPAGAAAGLFASVAPVVLKTFEGLAATAAGASRPAPQGSSAQDQPDLDDEPPSPDAGSSAADGSHRVLPGQAAACGYCPMCQAIALFRTVPMATWQRLGSAVVEAADSAVPGDWTARPPRRTEVVVHTGPQPAGDDPVDALLADLGPAAAAHPSAQD